MPAETIGSMAVHVGIDLSDFEKNSKEFQKSFGKLGGQMQKVGTKIGASFGAAAVGIGLALGSAVSKAAEFDSEMSRVGAIAGGTSEDLDHMRQTALNLGASTSKSASEVAKGMELMAAKGYDANQVISAMPGVIAAAEASGEDMALVADTVASALNAFGLAAGDASKVADVLAKSANTSAAGVLDLQYAFKYAAPIFKASGYSMEQLAAATGIMSDAGMKGEQAGTTLRMAMIRLSKPPKDAAAQLKALGVQVTDSAGQMLPLDSIIGQLGTSMQGMGGAQKNAALATIFGAEAMTGMLSLVEAGPEKFNALTQGLVNSGGASAEAAAKMKDNLAGSMDQLSGAVETLQIGLGSALTPAIRYVADALSGLANWFNNLPGPMKQAIAIGAALTAGLFLLTAGVGVLVAGLGFLAAAEWAAILPIAGMVAAIVLVTAVIVALAILIYQNWGSIKAFTLSAWAAISKALKAAWDVIVGYFKWAWSVISPIVTAGWEAIKAIFTAYLGTIKAVVSAVWEAIKTIFSAALLVIVYLVTGQWDKIGGVFSAAGEKLKGIIGDAWDKIKTLWSAAFEVLVKSAGQAWTGIKQVFIDAWNGIKSFWSNIIPDAMDMGRNIMKGMISGVESMASSLASKARDIVKSAIAAAKSALGINSPSKVFMEIGMFTGKGLEIGLDQSASGVASAAGDLAMAPVGAYQDALSFPGSSNGSVAASPQSGAGQDVIINLDGKEIARSVSKYQGRGFRGAGAVT